MPYVTQKTRNELLSRSAETEGELNYVITNLVIAWLTDSGSSPNYSDFNAAIGVLESVKLELYRRMIVPYEDLKKEQNGDVYLEGLA